MSRILVTGATGFVGRRLFPHLNDLEIVAAVRSQETRLPGVTTIPVDLADPDARRDAAVAGADVVIHLAALVHNPSELFQRRNRDLYEAVNVKATRNLAEAAARNGVRSFIFMSTIGVHGRTTDGRGPFTEDDKFDPHTVYTETKVAAERALMEISARTGLRVTILRTPLIYGRGAAGNLRTLLHAVKRGWPLPFASIRNRRALLGVNNLAAFIGQLARHPEAAPATLILADDQQVSTPELVRLLGDALHRPARLFPFPPSLIKRAFAASGRPGMAAITTSLAVDTARARSRGWAPAISLAEGFRESFAPDAGA